MYNDFESTISLIPPDPFWIFLCPFPALLNELSPLGQEGKEKEEEDHKQKEIEGEKGKEQVQLVRIDKGKGKKRKEGKKG